MNFDEVINNRQSAREFTDKNISDEQLQKILYSASTAPSAKNRQPWKFYILNDTQKNHIIDMLIDWETCHSEERTSVKGSAQQIKSSNKMILIYSDNYKSKTKTEFYKKPDYISIRLCIGKYEFTSS